MIAALFVQRDGCYFGLPGVDPWDEARDARRYAGPWPVVAHPPCARWCKLAGFVEHVYPGRFPKGQDEGCFASALASVRKWGGVLEHPEGSAAWAAHDLIEPPRWGGWVVADWQGGWTCCVEQGAYGHMGRKATWLYASGVDLPSLEWGPASGSFSQVTGVSHNGRRASRTGVGQRLSKRQRAATPAPFRDLLISIATTAHKAEGHPHEQAHDHPRQEDGQAQGAVCSSPSRPGRGQAAQGRQDRETAARERSKEQEQGMSTSLRSALVRLEYELPGWWWRVGVCSVSADATIGPDRAGPDADLLQLREFDEGFDSDLRQPATAAEALNGAIDKALAARSAAKSKGDP